MGLSAHFIARTRHLKGFLVTYQWVNGEPAMCIMREFLGRKCAYVICLSSAYKYADVPGLLDGATRAADVLNAGNERHAVRNIADIIIEGLEDLLKMKPEPVEAEIARGERQIQAEFDARSNSFVLH